MDKLLKHKWMVEEIPESIQETYSHDSYYSSVRPGMNGQTIWNELVMQHMEKKLGIDRERIVNSVAGNKFDNFAAIYFLLEEHFDMVVREPLPLSMSQSMHRAASVSGRMLDHVGIYQMNQQRRRVPAAVVEAVQASGVSAVERSNFLHPVSAIHEGIMVPGVAHSLIQEGSTGRPPSPVSPGNTSPIDISIESVPGRMQQWNTTTQEETSVEKDRIMDPNLARYLSLGRRHTVAPGQQGHPTMAELRAQFGGGGPAISSDERSASPPTTTVGRTSPRLIRPRPRSPLATQLLTPGYTPHLPTPFTVVIPSQVATRRASDSQAHNALIARVNQKLLAENSFKKLQEEHRQLTEQYCNSSSKEDAEHQQQLQYQWHQHQRTQITSEHELHTQLQQLRLQQDSSLVEPMNTVTTPSIQTNPPTPPTRRFGETTPPQIGTESGATVSTDSYQLPTQHSTLRRRSIPGSQYTVEAQTHTGIQGNPLLGVYLSSCGRRPSLDGTPYQRPGQTTCNIRTHKLSAPCGPVGCYQRYGQLFNRQCQYSHPLQTDMPLVNGLTLNSPANQSPLSPQFRFNFGNKLGHSNGTASVDMNQSVENGESSTAMPSSVRFAVSVNMTSAKSVPEIMDEIQRVLTLYASQGLSFSVEKFLFNVEYHGIVMDMEVCQLPGLSLNGIRLRRISGNQWTYKALCDELLHNMKLQDQPVV
jgi:hypothetical protein